MRVVARSCAEAAIVVQAAEDEIEDAFAWEGRWVAEEVERGEAPVDAAYAKMFGEMVFELIAALLWVSVSVCGGVLSSRIFTYCIEALDVGDVLLHDQLQFTWNLSRTTSTSRTCCERHLYPEEGLCKADEMWSDLTPQQRNGRAVTEVGRIAGIRILRQL